MISKSFIVQAFIALTIFAASLTSSVNAAAVAPARIADFAQKAAVPTTATATNKRRFGPRSVFDDIAGVPDCANECNGNPDPNCKFICETSAALDGAFGG